MFMFSKVTRKKHFAHESSCFQNDRESLIEHMQSNYSENMILKKKQKYFAHESRAISAFEANEHVIKKENQPIYSYWRIGFYPFRTTLTTDAEQAFNMCAEKMQKVIIHDNEYELRQLEICGVKDNIECGWHPFRGHLSNWRISRLRAEVSSDYLQKKGIPQEKILVTDLKNNHPRLFDEGPISNLYNQCTVNKCQVFCIFEYTKT